MCKSIFHETLNYEKPSNLQTFKPSKSELQNFRLIELTICFFLTAFSTVHSQSYDMECYVEQGPTVSFSGSCNNIELDIDQINQFPEVKFRVAFHFRANNSGQNFTCNINDPIVNQNVFLHAPTLVNSVIGQMNLRMSNALLQNGSNGNDTNIRFELSSDGDCEGIFIYENNESFIPIQDAVNIFIEDTNNPLDLIIRGFAFLGQRDINSRNWLKNFLNGSNNWWDLGRHLNHEFGHTMNLNHAFCCDNVCGGIDIVPDDNCCAGCLQSCNSGNGCSGCSPDELMMAYGSQLNVTECELSEMWKHILSINPSQEFDLNLCDGYSDDLIIESGVDEIWTSNRISRGNVRIQNGASLTITCRLSMGDSKMIFVEEGGRLIVEGGEISELCSSWKGIIVEGGVSSGYDVEVKDGSIIENASVAAVSMFSPTGGWLLGGNGNAKVLIENSTFNNCDRMCAMGSFPQLYNSSKFTGNIQNGGRLGISNWNCLGVVVEGNKFNDQKSYCINTIDGSFQSIYDNEFYSQNIDVLLVTTSILESSNIVDNEFNGSNTGIHSLGGSIGHMSIRDNEFDNQFFGVFFDNHTVYDIEENEFNTDFGVVSASNGGAPNSVTSNEFYTSIVGIYPFSDNDGYNFTLNCFETGLVDANIDDSIFDVIKTFGGAAGNCFSHGGTIGSVLDIDGSMDNFTYYENDNLNEDCYRVLSTNAGFSIDVDFESEADCGVGSGDPDKFNPCAIHEDEEDRLRAEQLLLAKIAWVQQHNFLTDEQKNRLIKLYERCLNRNKRKKAEEYLKGGDYASAIALYEGAETSTEDKLILFGIYMVKQDYSTARAYLNEMTSDEDQNISDFKLIQNINLDRLGDQNYEISDSEMSKIRTVAEKHHTYSAYAKALLYLYTKELLVTPLPDLSQSIASRSIAKKAKQDGIDLYPNPTTNIVSVLNIDLSDKLEVSIFDINGRLVLSSFVSTDQNDITLTQLSAGLYNIFIYKEDSVIYQDKIIKL